MGLDPARTSHDRDRPAFYFVQEHRRDGRIITGHIAFRDLPFFKHHPVGMRNGDPVQREMVLSDRPRLRHWAAWLYLTMRCRSFPLRESLWDGSAGDDSAASLLDDSSDAIP